MFSRVALVFLLVLSGAVATARAFVPTGFPDQSEIDAGLVRRWADYLEAPGQPFVLTYAIDPNFMAGEDPETVAGAIAAIEAALHTWSYATCGLLRFEPSPWGVVRNTGNQPPSQFVGPPYDDWWECVLDCNYDSDCIGANCPSPGWGAHIDFFSEPTGYTVSTGGVTYEMQGCNLGFTAVHRIGSSEIVSADIYLNSSWNWTVDPGQANPALATERALEPAPTMCACALDVHDERGADRAGCATQQASWVIDLETVLLHEVGHALGLEHPNETAQHTGAVNLSPWTFVSGWVRDGEEVMHGGYSGVKRDLRDDEVGAMAFLYPPDLYGDIDADGRVSFLDAFRALDIFEGLVAPDPWSVNRLDYNTRNGRIDMDELQQLLLWVVDPAGHPPGQVPSQNPAMWLSGGLGPSTITIGGTTSPDNIGVGGIVDVVLEIDNPDARTVQGWDLRIQFNSAVLLNPRYGPERDFLTGSSLIPLTVTSIGPGLSELRCGSLGFDQDASLSGSLATVRFDIDLAAAASVSEVDWVFNAADSEIVVALPYSHSFSKDANFPDETLNLTTIIAPAFLLDVDGSGAVDLDDLYAFTAAPVDVNYDSIIGCNESDVCDRQILQDILRTGELEDVIPDRASAGMGGLPSSSWERFGWPRERLRRRDLH